MDGHYFNSIDQGNADWLYRNFEMEEILDIVKGIASDQDSRPSWFLYGFLSSLL